MYTRAPTDQVSTMLGNRASLAEIEVLIDCQAMPEEDRAVLWMRAWSERPAENEQPRWGRGWTINWAEVWRPVWGRRIR